MNIAIIGASAGLGAETVKQALEKGFKVNALARNAGMLSEHKELTKINGTALSVVDLKKTITGTDAILVTIGTKDKKATTLFSDTAKALVKATNEIGYMGIVIVVSGFGTAKSAPYLGLFMRLVINWFLKDQYEDKTRMEEIIIASSMKWEIVLPGMLGNGPLTTDYKILPVLEKGMKVGKINRSNIAHYLLSEVVDSQFLFKQTVLTN